MFHRRPCGDLAFVTAKEVLRGDVSVLEGTADRFPTHVGSKLFALRSERGRVMLRQVPTWPQTSGAACPALRARFVHRAGSFLMGIWRVPSHPSHESRAGGRCESALYIRLEEMLVHREGGAVG